MLPKEARKCYFCNKRVSKDNSHKLVDNHEFRICSQCMQLGYWKTAIEVIKSNDSLEKKEGVKNVDSTD